MSVFVGSFNKRITAGGELPQEVLVAVWGVKEPPTVIQKPNTRASQLGLIAQSLET